MTSFDQCIPAPTGRFDWIERPYSAQDVLRLRGSVPVEHSLARRGALRLRGVSFETQLGVRVRISTRSSSLSRRESGTNEDCSSWAFRFPMPSVAHQS